MEDRLINALDSDPELLRHMESFLAQHQPAMERLMTQAVDAGQDVTSLVGVLSDGKGVIPQVVDIIPISLAHKLADGIKDVWPEIADHINNPRPEWLLLLVFFEGLPGFGRYGVATVRDVGAKA